MAMPAVSSAAAIAAVSSAAAMEAVLSALAAELMALAAVETNYARPQREPSLASVSTPVETTPFETRTSRPLTPGCVAGAAKGGRAWTRRNDCRHGLHAACLKVHHPWEGTTEPSTGCFDHEFPCFVDSLVMA